MYNADSGAKHPQSGDREQRETRERVNDQIRRPRVQLIDVDGNNLGVVVISEARRMADEALLDLVEINGKVDPPICKIVDYGKLKYERSKKEQQARKKQHSQKIKEVRFSLSIEENDLQTKINQIRKFLGEGNKVQANVNFKGREVAFKNRGREIIDTVITALTEVAKLEGEVSMDGKTMSAVFVTLPKKKNQKKKEKDNPQPQAASTPSPPTA